MVTGVRTTGAIGFWHGKHICNKTWVNGFPVEVRADEGAKIFIIANAKWEADDNSIHFLETDAFEVDPSTLGECTGLRDKNRKLIFEGDIVATAKRKFVVEWDLEQAAFVLRCLNDDALMSNFTLICGWECEIIGNIHDNPELLITEV